MARLKFKQIYSNLQYNTASSVLTLSGSQQTDFIISGSVRIVSTPTVTGSLTIQNIDSFGDSGSFFTMDSRIGGSHMKVPGPDGAMGFGGMCFPKDTAALLKWAEEYGQSLEVLNAAVKKNTLLRLTEPK